METSRSADYMLAPLYDSYSGHSLFGNFVQFGHPDSERLCPAPWTQGNHISRIHPFFSLLVGPEVLQSRFPTKESYEGHTHTTIGKICSKYRAVISMSNDICVESLRSLTSSKAVQRVSSIERSNHLTAPRHA